MDTKSSKCVHLVEGGTNGSQDVNMAPMGKTSLGRVIHARKRQKTSFTNLETHGDGSGYLACDTCSSGVPNEIVLAGIVPIGNILVGNNIGFQTRTKGKRRVVWLPTCGMRVAAMGTLANSVALYKVQRAAVEGHTMSAAETAAAKAVWGPMRCSRAKKAPWGLLATGFYVSPLWCVQY